MLDGKDGHFCTIKIYILMLNLGDLMDYLLNISLLKHNYPKNKFPTIDS